MRNVYYIGLGPSQDNFCLVANPPRACYPRKLTLADNIDDYVVPLGLWGQFALWATKKISWGLHHRLEKLFYRWRQRTPPDDSALLVEGVSVAGRDLLQEFVHAPCNGGTGVPWQAFLNTKWRSQDFRGWDVWRPNQLLVVTFNRPPWSTARGAVVVELVVEMSQ